MAIDVSNLRIELRTGSFASLYSGNVLIGNYTGMEDTINTRQAVGSTIVVGVMTAYELQTLVIGSEYLSLTQAQRDLWNAVVTVAGTGGIAISSTFVRGQIGAVWSAATSTRSNLSAAQIRQASRGEALFGEGTVIPANAIYVALNP